MYYVYVLYSPDADKCYYGCTKDLNRRVSEHQAGQNTSTAQAADWQLVYYEAYKSKQDATDREAKLKQYGATRGHLKNRITHSLNEE